MKIPDRLPTVIIDRSVLCWQELGLAEFMLQLEMEFDGGLDADRLARAMDLLLDAQPVLGCRFVKQNLRPYWQRVGKKERKNFVVAADEPEYQRFKTDTIDCTVGPQAKACLLRRADGDRLLLKVSHIAADAGGTKEVGADLAALYSRLEEDPDYIPAPNLKGDRGGIQVFLQVPPYKYPLIFSDFIKGMWMNPAPAPTLTLPLPEGCASKRPLQYILRHLSVERTTRLSAYGRSRQATLNDMVVAAAFRSLVAATNWDGRASLSYQMTFDYRRWYLPTERAGGICNLSAFEFPTPGRELGRDFDDTLSRVAACTRRRKKRMPGLAITCNAPLLFALPYDGMLAFFGLLTGRQIAQHNYPNTFTNMGPLKKEDLTFGNKAPRKAWLLTPPIYPPLFGFGMSGYAGSLTLSSGFPKAIAETAGNFLDGILSELPA
jgi:NRPS condensation-like uncharacterized protein